jgi:hypothetical protein
MLVEKQLSFQLACNLRNDQLAEAPPALVAARWDRPSHSSVNPGRDERGRIARGGGDPLPPGGDGAGFHSTTTARIRWTVPVPTPNAH